jgi:hypothetical protein
MTITAGHQPTASELEELRNLVRAGVTLRRAANQSIASGGSGSAIQWDTVDNDNSPSFITVTSSTLTIPTGYAGNYALQYRGAGAWTTRVFSSVTVTSALTGYPATTREDTNPSDLETSRSFGPIPLLAGDTVSVAQFHQTGSNVNVTAWITFYRVGP